MSPTPSPQPKWLKTATIEIQHRQNDEGDLTETKVVLKVGGVTHRVMSVGWWVGVQEMHTAVAACIERSVPLF